MTEPLAPSPSLTLDEPPPAPDPLVEAPFSPPSPAEVLLAIGKRYSPRWRQWYGPSARPVPIEREQAALALGATGTEILLAAHARDGQQAGHMLSDAAAIEKTLGIGEAVRARHTRLPTLSAAEQWETFRQEAEALEQEQIDAFIAHHDPDLGMLLGVGAWLRALDVESSIVMASESPTTTLTALSPDLVEWLDGRLNALSSLVREMRSVTRCRHLVERLRRLPPAETAEPRHLEIASQLLADTVSRFFTP